MKKTLFATAALSLLFMGQAMAQEQAKEEKREGFVFTTVKENPITSI